MVQRQDSRNVSDRLILRESVSTAKRGNRKETFVTTMTRLVVPGGQYIRDWNLVCFLVRERKCESLQISQGSLQTGAYSWDSEKICWSLGSS